MQFKTWLNEVFLPYSHVLKKVQQAAQEAFGQWGVSADTNFIRINADNRLISLDVIPINGRTMIEINFDSTVHNPDSRFKLDAGRRVGIQIQPETFALMNAFKTFLARVAPLGVRITYGALGDRRADIYARTLQKAGYQQLGDYWQAA